MGTQSTWGQFCIGDTMKHLLPLALVVAAAAVMATPVERTNGVIRINEDELALESNQHFTAVNRGCPDCNSLLLPNPHHLVDADESRGLAKRSPKKFKILGKKSFKKTKVPGFNKPFKFGKKNLAKAKKGGKKGGKKLGKGAKKSAPLSVPALGLGAPALGGGGLAFGVPGTGFAGFVVPGASQAAFDYVTG